LQYIICYFKDNNSLKKTVYVAEYFYNRLITKAILPTSCGL
jgi:hypothetical protein